MAKPNLTLEVLRTYPATITVERFEEEDENGDVVDESECYSVDINGVLFYGYSEWANELPIKNFELGEYPELKEEFEQHLEENDLDPGLSIYVWLASQRPDLPLNVDGLGAGLTWKQEADIEQYGQTTFL